ncbi:hypothetical protein C8J57DRAFT_1356424 [Mycena rebaudengoi]|nr:hypothetical protein C8J57DRAFT_1356424 [Mycena rebaudengoi]
MESAAGAGAGAVAAAPSVVVVVFWFCVMVVARSGLRAVRSREESGSTREWVLSGIGWSGVGGGSSRSWGRR